MRLTLRTMLAYLDDILEPSDAQELAKKIEQSEFASGLVHRIRASIGRLRLSAPRALGQGDGMDANSVAEYLDNTLPSAAVPDFEKVCLESDVHLAEVASCHQILTLVLGEPAQIEPAIRERIYGISRVPETSSPPANTVPAANAQRSVTPSEVVAVQTPFTGDKEERDVPAPEPQQHEIPAYLRASRKWSVLPTLVSISLILLAVCLSAFLLGLLDERYPLAGLRSSWLRATETGFGRTDALSPSVELTTGSRKQPKGVAPPGTDHILAPIHQNEHFDHSTDAHGHTIENVDAADIAIHVDAPSFEIHDETPDPASHVDIRGSETPVKTQDSVRHFDAAVLERHVDVPDGQSKYSHPLTDEYDTDHDQLIISDRLDQKSQLSELPSLPPEPDGIVFDESRALVEGERTEKNGDVNELSRTGDLQLASVDVPAVEAAEPLVEIEPPVTGVARFTSEQQVLIRWEEELGAWLRLPSRAPLAVGDRFLVLPTYCPQVLLSNGLRLTFRGTSAFDLEDSTDNRVPTISMPYGRVVIASAGKKGLQIVLQAGTRRLHAKFVDAHSSVAIEVDRFGDLGSDPARIEAHTRLRVWATDGRIDLQEEGRPLAQIEQGQVFTWVNKQTGWVDVSRESVVWLDSIPLREIDRHASRQLESQLNSELPAVASLDQLTKDRRREVGSLATICLTYLDHFGPIVDALNATEQRSWWTHQFGSLQHALARSRESAAQVRRELEARRGRDGSELYRMLCGYSVEDLLHGADEQLVQYLAHESLNVRVLSIENLRRITGATFGYQPWVPARQRRASFVRWQKLQKSGQLAYKKPPLSISAPDESRVSAGLQRQER